MTARRGAAILATIFFLLGGCAAPTRVLNSTVPEYVSLSNGGNPLDPSRPSVLAQQLGGDALITYLEKAKARPLNILEISGGGQNGAFGIGVLKGWKDSGRMPAFDIVTGISVGALVSTFAFLGESDDIEEVARVFTTIDESDVAQPKSKISVVFGGDSLLDNAPLQVLIENTVTDEVIERVAAAYRKENRYLFIGVLNLDYRQLWVWNMTALAASDDPGRFDTYRALLLAASAVPLAFPPVEIDGHLYADGGTRDRLLVVGLGGIARREARAAGEGGSFFVLFNDQARSQPNATQRNLKSLAASSIGAMLDGQMETTIMRSYVAALSYGYEFHLLQVPDNFQFVGDGLSFSPQDMNGLFEAGRQRGENPDSWLTAPEAGQTVGSGLIRMFEAILE